MTRISEIKVVLLVGLSLAGLASAAKSKARKLDTARIEELTGAKGTLDAQENVFKVTLPRGDIAATAAGVRLTPAIGLTAWAAFIAVGAHTMTMGDMVMTEDQVNPVMSVALDNGLEVTALHNHFFWDAPKVMFMDPAKASQCRSMPSPAHQSSPVQSMATTSTAC